ncbi:MAG: hypothetical protein WCF06_06365, partial [Nitrososphaeraceae archaeon]
INSTMMSRSLYPPLKLILYYRSLWCTRHWFIEMIVQEYHQLINLVIIYRLVRTVTMSTEAT